MSRYVGILYKLKKILPLSARKNIFHSFVQSHLNYCSLVWGLGSKSNIEPLFLEQKKAIRALMPSFNSNYYKDGLTPCHTKPFFADHTILTVHSIILTNILTFMQKLHNFKYRVPSLVASIVSKNAPKPGLEENCTDWLASHSTQKLRNALSFKGPLFYLKYMPEIMSQNTETKSNNTTLNTFKAQAKSFVFQIQTEGRMEEWEGKNTPLYYVPGLPRNRRENIDTISYIDE